MNIKNIIWIIGILLVVLLSPSCSDMNELSDKFLDEGEKIYAAQVDSVSVHPGNNRVELEVFIKAQRIEILRIFWNNYKDSADLTVSNQIGVFKKELLLPENSYIFNLVSFDKYGNRSLNFEVSGRAYGEKYRGALSNRGVSSLQYAGNQLTINWASAPDNSILSELVYTTAGGGEKTLEVKASEKQTILTDWKWPTSLSFNTGYVPAQTAIDTLYADSRHYLSRNRC